jgi:hypothetical protein
MRTFAFNELKSDRRVWFRTSVVLFVLLGFVDPDGKGTGKTNLDSFFPSAFDMLWPSHWISGPEAVEVLSFSMAFLAIYLVVVAFISAMVGWLLQFVIVPLLPVHRRGDLNCGTVVRPPRHQTPWLVGDVSLGLGAFGIGTTVFGAVLTGLNGIQFWSIWFVWDQIDHALTGSHGWSSFNSILLLLIICLLNMIVSTLLARGINSPIMKVRLKAMAVLAVQLATVTISAETFGLQGF